MQRKIKITGLISLITIFFICLCSFVAVNVIAEKSDTVLNLSINTEYNLENLPLGKEKASYPVFDFTATDNNGAPADKTEIKVYYDVNGDTKDFGLTADDVLVVVKDNRFETEKAGNYVVEYLAVKDFDVAIEKLFVKVVSDAEYVAPIYDINSGIESVVNTGEKVYLPDGRIIADERFGKTTSNVSIEYQGQYDCGNIKINDYDERLKYFTPMVSGEYKVVYEVYDVLGKAHSVKFNKVISIVDSDQPIIVESSFARSYLVGETIKFPYVEAAQYIDGKVVFVPVAVTFNGNVIGEEMSFTTTESGVFDVVFTAKNAVQGLTDSTITYEVEVKEKSGDIPYINKFSKFEGFNGFYRTENSEGLENDVYVLETDGTSETAEMSFKTKIAIPFLQANIGIEKAYCNFTDLTILITDSKNASEQIELSVKKSNNGFATFYFNGFFVKTYKYLSGENKGKEIKFEELGSEFNFSYDYKTKSIVDKSGEVLIEIKSYLDGSEFTGFSSNKVYFKISISGISGKSQIKLHTLATEYISGATTDKTKPKIVFQTEIANNIAHTADVNSIVVIKKYDCFDLYDENVKTYLKIVSPSGNLVVDEVMTGDYEYKVTECGFYELIYEFVDSANQKRQSTGIIQVMDRIAPIVEGLPTLSFKTSVRVGDTYQFPTVEFKDNFSTELTTYIYLTYGNYQKVIVKNNEFKFEEAGEYVVKYSAVDEMGNTTVVTYTIVCK